MASVSRIPIKVVFEGVGEFSGEFVRFYAPVTVQQLLKLLPLEGAAAKWNYAVYFQVDLRRGAEKEVKTVRSGDILYWPPGRYILFAYKDATPPAQMVRVGRLRGDLDKLEEVRAGARIKVMRKD